MTSYRYALAAVAALSLALLGFAIARAGLAGSDPGFTGTTYSPPEPAQDFSLTDHRGREVALRDFSGSALLMFFGYTHCPDVCPTTLQKLSRVVGEMDVDTTDVRILLVTVDPERDTPEALADYVSRFGPFPIGLTGDPAALEELRSSYGVYAGPPPESHHPGQVVDIAHTTSVLGIDRSGDLRVLLPMEAADQVIARDIELLLRE